MTKPLTTVHMASSLSLFEIFCASHSPGSLPPPLSIWFHSELWFTLKSSAQVLLPPGILSHLPLLSGQVAIPERGISSFVALITATVNNVYDYLINMFSVEWNSEQEPHLSLLTNIILSVSECLQHQNIALSNTTSCDGNIS